MPNPFSKLKIRNIIYDVKDAIARSSIGNLSDLQTEHKDNLVDAINDAAQSGGGGGGASPYTQNPSSLGEASPGSINQYARGDHVHPMPSASDVGALPDSYTPPPEVAWFARGTSTSAEIEAAYQAGKVCIVISGSRFFWLNRRVSETKHTFVSTSYDQIYTTTCDNNNWTDTNRTVPLRGNGTPHPLGTASAGSSDNVSRQDHVHAMPSASDVGAVAVAQGVAHAGEFVVVGSDGNITTITMQTWQGGSY